MCVCVCGGGGGWLVGEGLACGVYFKCLLTLLGARTLTNAANRINK